MANAASALMPLGVLQNAAATAGATVSTPRAVPTAAVTLPSALSAGAGGPIHHQPSLGRFRYSPLAASTSLTNAAAAAAAAAQQAAGVTPIGVGAHTNLLGQVPATDLLTTSALLQLQFQQAALQQAAIQQAATVAAANIAVPTGKTLPGESYRPSLILIMHLPIF